jgi:predicted  nucleic acid-binding Zn-ribbon protein
LIELNSAVIALIGTIFGGAGLKVAEGFLNRSKNRLEKEKFDADTASNMREELRKEVSELRGELRKVEGELDIWRGKYYDLLDQFIQVKSSLDASLRQMKAETQNLREQTGNTGELPLTPPAED